MICRGGDDTQKRRGAKRTIPKLSPLEFPGAANKRILQFTQVYRRTSADGTSGQYAPAFSNKLHPCNALMNIREHFHSFHRLLKLTWCLLLLRLHLMS